MANTLLKVLLLCLEIYGLAHVNISFIHRKPMV